MVRDKEDGSGHFLHSKKGVTQGDPLAMIAYGIGVIPLIIGLHEAHPCVTNPWYADDVRAGGPFEHILAHFMDMQVMGPPRGYFPEPTKSILVVSPGNVLMSDDLFQGMGVKIVTGRRYLGVFIRDVTREEIWLAENSEG